MLWKVEECRSKKKIHQHNNILWNIVIEQEEGLYEKRRF